MNLSLPGRAVGALLGDMSAALGEEVIQPVRAPCIHADSNHSRLHSYTPGWGMHRGVSSVLLFTNVLYLSSTAVPLHTQVLHL